MRNFLVLVILATHGRIIVSQQAKVILAMKHDPERLASLSSKLNEISDPTHPSYAHWLTSEEVAAFVRIPTLRVSETTHWVQKLCNEIDGQLLAHPSVSGQGDFLEVTISGDTLSADLCAQRVVKSWATDAANLVEGAFLTKTATAPNDPSSKATSARASLGAGIQPYGPPSAQKAAYGIPEDLTAVAPSNLQLVWGPGTFGYLPSDLEEFYATYNVTGATTADVRPFGFRGTVGGDNFMEATLDVTYMSSMAPHADTVVANTNSSASTEETFGFGYALLAFSHLLANAGLSSSSSASIIPLPTVVSMSLGSLSYDSCHLLCSTVANDTSNAYDYSDCEAYMSTQRQVCMYDSGSVVDRINAEFLKAASRGVTLLAATGDGGSHFSFGAFSTNDAMGQALNAASCAYALPTFPAESPYVLGVGGEQWNRDDGTVTPEAPIYWAAGGAGFSRRFEMPDYQRDAVDAYLTSPSTTLPPASSFDPTMRAYPDVVALALGIPLIVNGTQYTTGGTSASAPSFAGVVSLLNAIRLRGALPPLGFLNPRLYAAAGSWGGAESMFYDITYGNSSCGGDGYNCGNGFVATCGWDAVTGWGSPRWEGLVTFLTNDSLPSMTVV